MHIIIGILLACALLYFWLLGNWFARVVAFLGLAPVLGAAGMMLGVGAAHNGTGQFLGLIAAAAAAWPLASLPTYVLTRRFANEHFRRFGTRLG